MSWSEVNFEQAIWTITGEGTKNKRTHRVHLNAQALRELSRIREMSVEGPFVFPNRRKPGRATDSVQKAFAKIREISGVDCRIHDLRRTVASSLAEVRVPRDVISAVLNHTLRDVTGIYDRYSRENEKRDALFRWGEVVEGVVSQGAAGI